LYSAYHCVAKRRFGRGGLPSLALVLAALATALFCFYPACAAQDDPEPTIGDYSPPDQPEVSRDEWRQRIEQAKRRAKEAARERREHPELHVPIPEDPEIVASERVLNDESLQRGDIVTTKKGMFVYRGRTDQSRREDDFVPIAPKPAR
jgi:hypothetical protein